MPLRVQERWLLLDEYVRWRDIHNALTDCYPRQMLCRKILKEVSSQTDCRMRNEVSELQSRFSAVKEQQMAAGGTNKPDQRRESEDPVLSLHEPYTALFFMLLLDYFFLLKRETKK